MSNDIAMSNNVVQKQANWVVTDDFTLCRQPTRHLVGVGGINMI